MRKQVHHIYSICSLAEDPHAQNDFMADHFAHYLEAHRDLQFPHKHSFYHLVFFSKGSGSHSIDFVRFPVMPGQVYFMVPGQVHTWEFETAPDGFIINFSEQYINALIADPRYLDQFAFFSGAAAEQVIMIPGKIRPEIIQLFETITGESNSHEALKDDMARTALIQLLIKVSRLNKDNSAGRHNNYNSVLLRNFQKLIDLHYKEMKLTKEYAAMLYVTPNHLNALSKDITGRSAGELIRDRVVLEAKRLLVNAALNISQIAGELNFVDNSYFSKFFKKYAGVTPELFRNQLIKK